jgi:glutaredoxin
MSIIRLILGKLILFFNWLFAPRGIKRSPQQQARINQLTSSMTLYQYEACPFCVKVRRAMKRYSLAIQTRDVKRSDLARDELLDGGGRLKVPCLRIDGTEGQAEWLYESSAIIRYLEEKCIAPASSAAALPAMRDL